MTSNVWAPFQQDNTEGYTDAQLAELNRAFELEVCSHLADSVYDNDGELDAERWAADDSDDYKAAEERVLKRFNPPGA